jgi:hypothetical protein
MNNTEAVNSLASTDGFFRHWMPYSQRDALTLALRSEEKNFFVTMLTELRQRIETMAKTYEQDGKGCEAIVYLHYFHGNVDAWITEKDAGDESGDPIQSQAFGRVCLTGNKEDAELGYVSIQELIDNGVELDLYWKLKTLGEL